MTSRTSAPREGQLVRLNAATLQYEPCGYLIRHYAPDMVCIRPAPPAPRTFQFRLPHPEVLTEVGPDHWAYDPPLSDAQRACLTSLAKAALGAQS